MTWKQDGRGFPGSSLRRRSDIDFPHWQVFPTFSYQEDPASLIALQERKNRPVQSCTGWYVGRVRSTV
jgi:hypothetical protein